MAVEAYYIVAGIIGTAQTSKISLPLGSRGQEPAFQVKKIDSASFEEQSRETRATTP